MRILIYGINFAPELTGIGKYTGEMAAFLARQGHQVRVVTAPPYYPQWHIQAGYKAAVYRKEIWQGVQVYRCPLWVPGKAGRISGWQRLLHLGSFALSSFPVAAAQIRWKPERVIVLAPSLFNAPPAAQIARLAGGKAWLHIQDFELDAAQRLGILPGSKFFYNQVQRWERGLYRKFHVVSTISNRMAARLKEKGVAPERIRLFPNWVDPQEIYPILGYNPLREELSISASKQVVLYSGSMGEKQGIEVLVEAARRLEGEKDILFLLCGDGPARAKLEELAAGLGDVRFLPLQPAERLNELLNLAAIHVLPQVASAADLVMPSKLIAMLGSGRPAIVMAQPGTELADVTAPLGRIVPSQDAQTLSEAILELTRQPGLQEELGRRGREYVEKTWAKELVLGNFLEALTSL